VNETAWHERVWHRERDETQEDFEQRVAAELERERHKRPWLVIFRPTEHRIA
jgi:hypothetical protein